jgi:glycosyltransferase involved in cell wall biosynthesis
MISVVIPTRNRSEILGRTLAALAEQRHPADGFEVVVVDNGSTDATRELVGDLAENFPTALRLQEEPRPGPAAARNRGAEAAEGEVLLFLGDDMLPATPDLVAGHASLHQGRSEPTFSVLGRATWHPREPVSIFMRWLEEGGPQFAYGRLSPGPVSAGRYFYTPNASLKRQMFFDAGGFDERFPHAAVEDIDLGTRLEALGLELVYEPSLLVHHVHPTTIPESLHRMEHVGRSVALYHRLHPEGRAHPDLAVPEHSQALRFVEPAARVFADERFPRPVRERAWLVLHHAAYERGYAIGPPDDRGD